MTKTLKKGFTLVELIVVIAIIAVLSTVSVVGYSAFMKNANQSRADQEMAQVKNVLMAEAVEGVTKDQASLTIDGTTLVFTFTGNPTETLFENLVAEAGVPANMVDNLTLVQAGTSNALSQLAHILYTIGDAKSFIVVSIVVIQP